MIYILTPVLYPAKLTPICGRLEDSKEGIERLVRHSIEGRLESFEKRRYIYGIDHYCHVDADALWPFGVHVERAAFDVRVLWCAQFDITAGFAKGIDPGGRYEKEVQYEAYNWGVHFGLGLGGGLARTAADKTNLGCRDSK